MGMNFKNLFKNTMKITNMVVSGRLPLKKKINYSTIVKKSKLLWQIANEDVSPILSIRFYREKKKLNVHKKRKSVYASIWNSGAINIVGVKSLSEAEKYYTIIFKELLRIDGDL